LAGGFFTVSLLPCLPVLAPFFLSLSLIVSFSLLLPPFFFSVSLLASLTSLCLATLGVFFTFLASIFSADRDERVEACVEDLVVLALPPAVLLAPDCDGLS